MKLFSHKISHENANNKTMQTNALKVVTTENDSQAILDGLIHGLTKTPKEYQASLTVDYKLILFQKNAIGKDGIAKLVERQSKYLHKTYDISVLNRGDGEDNFSLEDKETNNGSLRQ